MELSDVDLDLDFNRLNWSAVWWHILSFFWLIFAIYVIQKNKVRQFLVLLLFLLMTSSVALLSTNLEGGPHLFYSVSLLVFSLALLIIVRVHKVSPNKRYGPLIFRFLILLQLAVVIEDYCKVLDYPITSQPFEGEILDVDVLYNKRYTGGDVAFPGRYKMHITCKGTGKHLVLLDAGIPFSSASLAGVAEKISEKYSNTTVCTYDRLGYGWSERTQNKRTSLNMINELRSLMAKAQISHKRIIYIGWSFGGLNAQLYGRLFRQEMLGLVLVDSMDHHVLGDDPALAGDIDNGVLSFTLTKILAPIGIIRLAGSLGLLPPECGFPLSPSLLPSESEEAMRATFYSQKQFLDVAFDELNDLKLALNQSHDLLSSSEKQPYDVPTVVLRSNLSVSPAYLKSHKRLLRISAKKVEIITNKSDHYIPMRDPDAIVNALRALFILRKTSA